MLLLEPESEIEENQTFYRKLHRNAASYSYAFIQVFKYF